MSDIGQRGPTRRLAHPIRGLLFAVAFGPLLVAGLMLVVWGLLTTLLSGWLPDSWLSFSKNPADWVLGFGMRGDAASYASTMVGGLLAFGSWAAIRWAFVGGADDRERSS